MPARLFALFALFALLVASPALAAPEPPPQPRLWEVSRIAAAMRADMQAASPYDLLGFVYATRERLVLSDASDGVERAADLELAVRLGVAVQMLAGAPAAANAPWFPHAEQQTAYLLHAIGHRYETRDEVRFAIDSLAGDGQGGGAMLVEAIRLLRPYGATWLRRALAARASLDASALFQRGLVELHEGAPGEAAQTLTAALGQRPDRELAATACEAMLEVGHRDVRVLAETLRDNMVKSLPALAGTFARCFERDADLTATRAFEARDGLATDALPGIADQVERYLRLSRPGAAELIAKAAVDRFPADPEALHLLATLYFRLDRWESLRTLLAEVTRVGRMDDRLGEIRLAARVGLAIQAAMGAAPHPLAEGDVAAEVRASKGPPLVRHAQSILLALGTWLGAKHGSAAGVEARQAQDAAAAIEAELKTMLTAHPKDPDALRLALVAMAALERLDEGLAMIGPRVPKLAKPDQATVRAVLARVELGEALRRRDPERVTKARKLVAEARRSAADGARAELDLADLVAALALPTLTGQPLGRDALNALRAKLVALAWAFDTTTPEGRGLEQARLLTLATGDGLGGDEESARVHLRAARAVRDHALGRLAGGLAMLMIDDGPAAADLCGRIPNGERPGLAQVIAACRALGKSKAGGDAKADWREVLALWGDANLPTTLPAGAVRPIFGGEFDIGVTILHGKPLSLAVSTRPLVLAVPELVPDRATTEELTR